MAALSPAVWVAGLAGLIVLDDHLPESDPRPHRRLRRLRELAALEEPQHARDRAYYAIPGRTRAIVAVVYLGLAAALSVGVAETFVSRGL